ncbi:MAG: enoyl-CoA hydratase/isomerase family protein [Novosphingobium sp.]
MTEETASPVSLEVVDDHVTLIRINRPKARNAVDGAVTQAMADLVDRIEADATLRAVVLGSASPDFFCAGADLEVVAEWKGR